MQWTFLIVLITLVCIKCIRNLIVRIDYISFFLITAYFILLLSTYPLNILLYSTVYNIHNNFICYKKLKKVENPKIYFCKHIEIENIEIMYYIKYFVIIKESIVFCNFK